MNSVDNKDLQAFKEKKFKINKDYFKLFGR
ncbi:hypothetical protein Q7M_721 [Borrelia crocidurae str. Achema]|uniref:Uncharacterized protein n=1 Tax=Borrelia crocidurae (strain Achema) TaxID=1155096 RepID=I0FDE4_BORCA|nr:hypothetical protein Q7M_721 [Borrelia crocidurae str. Achema]